MEEVEAEDEAETEEANKHLGIDPKAPKSGTTVA